MANVAKMDRICREMGLKSEKNVKSGLTVPKKVTKGFKIWHKNEQKRG